MFKQEEIMFILAMLERVQVSGKEAKSLSFIQNKLEGMIATQAPTPKVEDKPEEKLEDNKEKKKND